eukprot:CAMPEP_0116930080 /NCGR_PEP_ID=MMETSP0467-20121206/26977_1 /TAXON_ID=283647 /ORGANISM="Mesodinium pulex, Strain SPMC105" /LENGTH=62 /DNA_ID=CAMNT_0004610199 /DNA_START=337 /DNA_END=525 /DNA_ORIENTATION=-
MGDQLSFEEIDDFYNMMKVEQVVTKDKEGNEKTENWISIEESTELIWKKLEDLWAQLTTGKK